MMTLLFPSIQSALNTYYSDYLTLMPSIGLYNIKILKMERLGEYQTYDFLIKLELLTYVGPHLDVGLDHITLRINPKVNVKVEKFEHIKSYDLPPYYSQFIKKSCHDT